MKKRLFVIGLLIVLVAATVFAEIGTFQNDPDAIEAAAQSVLMLTTFDKSGEPYATGSGFMMFDNRTLVTNYHVLKNADSIIAESDDGFYYFATEVLIANEQKDIAILRLMTPTVMQPLHPATADPKRGEPVIAIGSPKGMKNTVSNGIVSSVFAEDDVKEIQFTASISHGSSGGALFNSFGEVIGITSSYFAAEDAHDINFAVNISEVIDLYSKWNGKDTYEIGNYRAARYGLPTPTPKPSSTPKPTSTPTPTPSPTPTPKPTSKPTSTPAPETKIITGTVWSFTDTSIKIQEKNSPKKTSFNMNSYTRVFGLPLEVGASVEITYYATSDRIVKYVDVKKRAPTPSPVPTPTSVPTPSPASTPSPTPIPTPTPELSHSGTDSGYIISLDQNEVTVFARERVKITPVAVMATEEAEPVRIRYTWTSSDRKIATVENGYISGVASGDCIITCTSASDPEVYTLCFVHVIMHTASVKLDTGNATLYFDPPRKTGVDSVQLHATVLPEDAYYPSVIWTSSNPSVATVDENGIVKAVAVGSAKIIATSADDIGAYTKKAECYVSVVPAISKISLKSSSSRINVGYTTNITASIEPTNAGNRKLIWSSSDEKVATVNNGQVRGIGPGTCNITCDAADGGGATKSIRITVIQPVTKLTATKSEISVYMGSTVLLSDYLKYEPINASEKRVSWKASDSSVVSVHSTGQLKAIKAGNCSITAATTDGSNKSVVIKIKVFPQPYSCTAYFKGGSSYAQWQNTSNDKIMFRCQVSNMENAKTIRAFELEAYTTDVWGNKLNNGKKYTWSTTVQIGPGKTAYSDYYTFPSGSRVGRFYVTIKRVMYTDGLSIMNKNDSYPYSMHWEMG